jgi:hypothetical protein
MPKPADWAVQFDDLLCLRWRRCIFCCAAADRHELRYLDTGPDTGYAMTLGLCAKCVKADATEQRRQALVERHAGMRA